MVFEKKKCAVTWFTDWITSKNDYFQNNHFSGIRFFIKYCAHALCAVLNLK